MDTRTAAAEIYKKMLEGAVSSPTEEIDASPQEKAFVKRLILTALRRQEFLKKIINGYSQKPLPQKLAPAHLLIILGAVEILYFHTPEYAVVSSYVDIAKKSGNKYGGGFVNAVLRKICQNKQSILQTAEPIFFPKAFRRILRDDYSPKQIAAIEKSAFIEPPLDLTVKSDAAGWAEKLGGRLMPNNSVRLYAAGNINALPGYDQGDWWVQDMASALPVAALGNIRGQKVLDLCAAPGGKTAQLLNAGAEVTALDVSRRRLDTMEQNLRRLKFSAADIVCADAVAYLHDNSRQYDIILLDAPCSATGTLRRHPEIVHTRGLKDIEKSAAAQKKMLAAAAPRVKKGGLLLYAVCSLSKSEGEKQIFDFIAACPQFKILPVSPSRLCGGRAPEIEPLLTPEGFIRCLPSHFGAEGGIDGFFAALLQKES